MSESKLVYSTGTGQPAGRPNFEAVCPEGHHAPVGVGSELEEDCERQLSETDNLKPLQICDCECKVCLEEAFAYGDGYRVLLPDNL